MYMIKNDSKSFLGIRIFYLLIYLSFNLLCVQDAKASNLYQNNNDDSLIVIAKNEKTQRGNSRSLIITKIEQYHHEINQVLDVTSKFEEDKHIYLDPRGNLVNIHFEIQPNDNPSQYDYAYRIKGVEEEWVPFYEPYIQLDYLPFGIHQLEIKALMSESSIPPSYLLIPVISKKPFYLTSTFIVGLIGLLIGLFGLLFFLVKKRILSKQATLEYKIESTIENTLHGMLATQKSNTDVIPSNQISDLQLPLPSSSTATSSEPDLSNQDEEVEEELTAVPIPVPANQTDKAEASPTAQQELSPKQEAWLSNLKTLIEENLNHHQFNTEFVASQVGLSRRQLQRRLKEVTGLSPKDYIKDIRMNEAKKLLENQTCDNVGKVAERVGLSNVTHFTEIYTQYFGTSPKDYFSSK